MGVHEAAKTGFGAAAGEYERSRPEYPPAAVARLCRELAIAPGAIVLDLACGTGKMTRALAAAGATVVGVDPVEAMLGQFAAAVPGVPAAAGVAERLPLREGSLDAVVVAQGFHWFDGEAALAEIHRVLRPGGGLGLVWNVRDATVSWVGGLDRIFDRHEGDVMRFWRGEWRTPFLTTGAFAPLERVDFRHQQPTSHQGVVERVQSVSFIASLDAAERARVTEEVRAMLRADPLTKDRDEFPFPYITQVYTTRRIP